jgi:hypothetical protein
VRSLQVAICVFAIAGSVCALAPTGGQTSAPASTTTSGQSKSAKSKLPGARTTTPAAPKVKFRPYEVVDAQQGGLVVSRFAVPQDWKTSSSVKWNYNDFYMPVHIRARTDAPDGASWIEFFPAEFFLWLDPAHDQRPPGPGSLGGIHHRNITLPEAMGRYVVARNRGNTKNLRILGYRPVNDLPKAFPQLFKDAPPQGEGICMRVSYELDGSPVDEEFYGFMSSLQIIPAGNMAEYHRMLFLAHSLGAKAGKLEAVRPLLGFMATSIESNPDWQKRYGEIVKMQQDYYQRAMAANYAQIRAAGERSRALTAQSDQFLHQIDASLAAQKNAQRSAPSGFASNDDFDKHADEFDQYVRGTEHMKDANGVVSDQYTDYNYHWTDGYGRFVHTDDPNLDPNRYLNGNYQQMTPVNP